MYAAQEEEKFNFQRGGGGIGFWDQYVYPWFTVISVLYVVVPAQYSPVGFVSFLIITLRYSFGILHSFDSMENQRLKNSLILLYLSVFR